MKTCSTCKKSKPLKEFYNNKSKPGGKDNQCKVCHNKSGKASFKKYQQTKKYKEHQHNMYINRLIRDACM